MASSSSNENPIQEELLCSVCLELYEDPVTLPCMHSFCLKCLRRKAEGDMNMLQTRRPEVRLDPNRTFCTCPSCRKPAMLPTADFYRKNFNLANIVEKFKRMKSEKIVCSEHKQDVGLYCEDCEKLMCFSCFGLHRGHKIDDINQLAEKYKSKIELTLVPGLNMKQRQLEEAFDHWTNIIEKEKRGKMHRNGYLALEMMAMKKMFQSNIMEKIIGINDYNKKVTENLIRQCEEKKSTVETDLTRVKKLVNSIVEDTVPAKIFQTYSEITKRGDHDIDKLPDCAKDLQSKGIKMKFVGGWREKLLAFCDGVKVKFSGVEEEEPDMPVTGLDRDDVVCLNKLPYKVTEEKETEMVVTIPISNVESLDCMFDRNEVLINFTTLNKEFLQQNPGTSATTVFRWKLKLGHEISPVRSKSSKTTEGIVITLIKGKKEHWGKIDTAEKTVDSGSSDNPIVLDTEPQPSTSHGLDSIPSPQPSTSTATLPVSDLSIQVPKQQQIQGNSSADVNGPSQNNKAITSEVTNNTIDQQITTTQEVRSDLDAQNEEMSEEEVAQELTDMNSQIQQDVRGDNLSEISTQNTSGLEGIDDGQDQQMEKTVYNTRSRKRSGGIFDKESEKSSLKKSKQDYLPDDQILLAITKEDIENFITEKISSGNPNVDVPLSSDVIKNVVLKLFKEEDSVSF